MPVPIRPDFPAGFFSICTGSYNIPVAYLGVEGDYTNKAPGGVAYRCSFRVTKAAYFIKRMIEVLAIKLNMDAAELRRINFIHKSSSPNRFPTQFLHHRRNGFQPQRFDQAAHVFMGVIGAFAHRLAGRQHEIIPQRHRHHLFDQPGAGAATGAGLGGTAHQVQRIRATKNSVNDFTLTNAVTATDFRTRRQGCYGCHGVRLGTPLIGGAKDQRLTHGGDIGAVLDQLKEPVAIGGIAIHHRTDQLIAFDHKAFTDAARGVAEHNILAPRAIGKIARAEQVTPGDFQPDRCLHRAKRGILAQQSLRQNLCLIVKRGNQTKLLLVMLNTFARRPNRRIAGLHHIIRLNTAPDIQLRVSGKTHFATPGSLWPGTGMMNGADSVAMIN